MYFLYLLIFCKDGNFRITDQIVHEDFIISSIRDRIDPADIGSNFQFVLECPRTLKCQN